MSFFSLCPLLRSQSQVSCGIMRRFSSRRPKHAYIDAHTNYGRERHSSGNATGFRVVAGFAICLGVGSAVAMAKCEEAPPMKSCQREWVSPSKVIHTRQNAHPNPSHEGEDTTAQDFMICDIRHWFRLCTFNFGVPSTVMSVATKYSLVINTAHNYFWTENNVNSHLLSITS